MCAVNDKLREEWDNKIIDLEMELRNENYKLNDIEVAKGQVQLLVDAAKCAIDNLNECYLGGDKIISSVRMSQKGYLERKDYYDEYIIKCKNAIQQINLELESAITIRENIPINCGSCDECNPPSEK